MVNTAIIFNRSDAGQAGGKDTIHCGQNKLICLWPTVAKIWQHTTTHANIETYLGHF